MKTCPFCAEEIQDAAIVCKHCGRELPRAASEVPSSAGPASPTSPGRWRRLLVLLAGAAVVVAVVLYLANRAGYQIDTEGAGITRQPVSIPIAEGKTSEIKAGYYLKYSFTLPAAQCRVVGRIEGVAGGNKDFEAFVMDDDNFRNWSTDHEARGFQSGRVVVWSPDVSINGPGSYHLVVSNAFSTFTDKAVTTTAEAICQ